MTVHEQFDDRALRNAFSRFATGVTVVTTRDAAGQPVGLTVNSFTSVSLSPPLLLFSLGLDSSNAHAFGDDTRFAVSVLRADQQALSDRFAYGEGDRFADLALAAWPGDLPVLADCLANFECATTQRVVAGDHVLIIARVVRIAAAGTGDPLLYYAGRYRTTAPPDVR